MQKKRSPVNGNGTGGNSSLVTFFHTTLDALKPPCIYRIPGWMIDEGNAKGDVKEMLHYHL